MVLCSTVMFVRIAIRIVPVFIMVFVCVCHMDAIMVVVASMIMRSGLSAIPIVSIWIPAASALALV